MQGLVTWLWTLQRSLSIPKSCRTCVCLIGIRKILRKTNREFFLPLRLKLEHVTCEEHALSFLEFHRLYDPNYERAMQVVETTRYFRGLSTPSDPACVLPQRFTTLIKNKITDMVQVYNRCLKKWPSSFWASSTPRQQQGKTESPKTY